MRSPVLVHPLPSKIQTLSYSWQDMDRLDTSSDWPSTCVTRGWMRSVCTRQAAASTAIPKSFSDICYFQSHFAEQKLCSKHEFLGFERLCTAIKLSRPCVSSLLCVLRYLLRLRPRPVLSSARLLRTVLKQGCDSDNHTY